MKRDVSLLKPVIVFLFLAFCLSPATASSLEYDHEIKLKKMSFSWKIKSQLIYIKLVAATKGWVGIGFNPTERMQDANFILGYVKNGKVKLTDEYGVSPREHINDTSMNGKMNVTDASGSEKGKSTTLEFSIPLDSGDAADKRINKNGFTTVLLAFGRGQDNFYSRHRFRTTLKVNLTTGKYK